MFRLLLLSVAVLAVSGCSRVIEGSTQDLTIETPGADGATCFLENEEFRYKIYAPQTIKITRTFYPLNVRCLAPGNRQKTVTVRPKIHEATFMNAANGFVPGMIIDYNSRAFYKLPSKIVVDFTDMAPQPMPPPHYDRLLKENPHLRGFEEWRPGLPALQRDMYAPTYELQRRESPSSSSAQEVSAPPSSGAPASSDALTREMNPAIFGKSESSGGFAGGTSAGGSPQPLSRDDEWIK